MPSNRHSFPVFAIVGLVLAGLVAGVVLSARFDWIPIADSADSTEKLPLPPSAAGPIQTFAPVAKAVTPAVVNISTSRTLRAADSPQSGSPFLNDPFFRQFFGEEFFRRFEAPRERRQNSLGSGVIVSADGYIVTNNHVIAKADEIKVQLPDGREFSGKVVGTDPPTDIAVVKIEAKESLPVVPWGNSEQLTVGEYVLAVGNPFGLNSTVTMGIVSAVGRASVGIADYEDFIQTDAAINPGNSGGPLVNVRGEVVGINTAIFSQSGGSMGIGFAVPSSMARTVMDSLIKSGKVTRGWLGVSAQAISPALAKQFNLNDTKGALVTDVTVNSPAAAAGLKVGDVIVSFDGKPVDTPSALRNVVAQTAIGKAVNVDVVRNNKRESVSAKIAEQPRSISHAGVEERIDGQANGQSALTGLQVQNLTPEIARQLKLPANTKGVVVTGVAPDSVAARSGIVPGDVILEVNRQAIRSIADLKALSEKLSRQEGALLLIDRRGQKLYVALG